MLQNIRRASKGWVSWVIVIAISIPFALWGIEKFNLSDNSAEDVIAQIGDHEITNYDFYRELQNYNQRLREQYGDDFDRIDQERVRRNVLQFLFGRGVIFADAEAKSMIVSDNQIKNYIAENKAFEKDDGSGFDAQKYVEYLSASNLTAPVFENQIRESEIYNQYVQGYWDSNFLTKYELKQLYQLLNHERKVAYVLFPWDQKKDEVEVTDEEISVKYEDDKNQFAVPEKVKIEYVSVSMEDLAKKVPYTEQQLKDFYEQRQSDFETQEERQVRHILVAEEDRDLAEKIRLKVLSGEDFSKLAKEYSLDTLSAEKGGDLGMISRGVMIEKFDDVIFSMKENEVKLVETEFGNHIVEVTKIKESVLPSLDEVKDKVIEGYQLEQASNEFYGIQEELSNLAFDHPDSLEQIKDKLDLPIKKTDWFSSHVGIASATITQYNEVREVAFSQQVKNDKLNSSVIDIQGQEVVVLRVVDVQAAYIKTLDEVKQKIKEELIKVKATAKLSEDVSKDVALLRSKQLSWKKFIKKYEFLGSSQTKLDWLSSRNINEETPVEESEVFRLAFNAPRIRSKDDGDKNGVFLETTTSLGNVAVVYMTNSKDAKVSDEDIAKDSEIWKVMNNFQSANLRNATLEVLQVRYPLPRVDLNELPVQ